MRHRLLRLDMARICSSHQRPAMWMRVLLPMLLLASSGCTATVEGDSDAFAQEEETATRTEASTSSGRVPEEVHELANLAKDLTAAYPPVSGALAVVATFLRLYDLGAGDPLKEQIEALHNHLDTGFAAIDWKETRQLSESRFATIRSSLVGAHQAVLSNTPIPHNEEVDYFSREAVMQAEESHAFMRYFYESATDGEFTVPTWPIGNIHELRFYQWKDVIAERPLIQGGNVYDWRVGVPVLMLDIALRLQVIAAVDPDFRASQVFNRELAIHHDALAGEYEKMLNGVRCNVVEKSSFDVFYPFEKKFIVACADIHTGDSNIAYFRYADFDEDISHRVEVAQASINMRQEILGRLPLTQMETMMTALNQLRTPPRPSAGRPDDDSRMPRLPRLPE